MERENREVTALVRAEDKELTVAAKPLPRYWLRVANGYKAAISVLCFVLAVFLVIFAVLSARSFTYDSLYYFGKDVATLVSLAREDGVIYYDYEGESARRAVYRGGVAVAHSTGVDIYAVNGELLLAVKDDHDYVTPRIAVSRDYLAVYDFGGNSFCICNSYAKLYEGQTEQPIYGVFVSDAGYTSIITGSDPTPAPNEPFYLSEVLILDADFNLVQHFGRATATVSAVISRNGRTVTLVGASESGAVVDIYTVGDEKPLSTSLFSGFPLAAGYTANNKLAVLTDTACYTLSTGGKLYDTVSYDNALLAAYSVDENGIALALEVDRLQGQYRILVLDKKGNVRSDTQSPHRVSSIALSREYVFVLGGNEVSYRSSGGDASFKTFEVPDGALSTVVLDERTVRVLFPAQALDLKASG